MRTIIALKALPQGQQPGDRVEVPDEAASILVEIGAAKYAEDAPSPRGRYQRRDLRVED
jgi:hypothetical protein